MLILNIEAELEAQKAGRPVRKQGDLARRRGPRKTVPYDRDWQRKAEKVETEMARNRHARRRREPIEPPAEGGLGG